MKEIIFGVISGVVASMGMGGGVILVLLFSLFSDVSQHIVPVSYTHLRAHETGT